MKIKRLLALVLFNGATIVPAWAERVELGISEPYAQGQYHAYASMWALAQDETLALGRKAVEGEDYAATITVDKTSFPARSTIDWHVPQEPLDLTGVYGYLQLSYGNYHGSRVPEPVEPAQVSAIDRLDVSLSFSYSGDTRFNLLNELFLLSDPTDVDSVLFEVGVFARASSEMNAYFNGGQQIGTYVDEQGREWRAAYRNSPVGGYYVMLIPANGEDVEGEFNWAGVFDFLVNEDVLDGTEWFTGIAVGVEPIAGAGQVQIDAFAVDYLAGS